MLQWYYFQSDVKKCKMNYYELLALEGNEKCLSWYIELIWIILYRNITYKRFSQTVIIVKNF